MDAQTALPGRDIGRFFSGAMLALALALAVPLLIGSFSDAETGALLALDGVLLIGLAIASRRVSRRLASEREALWALSRCDELTGIGNYRALQERLAEEISRHTRRSREFALAVIDLDGFKQVNEQLGHLEGDRLLTQIGEALREEVRGEDAVFRQGGDEFAVIAPETNGEEAEEVAARLRAIVRGCSRGGLEVSGATGFAIFPGDGRSVEELLDCADRDMLAAKRGGRPV